MNRTAWLTLASAGVVTLGLLGTDLGPFAPAAAQPAPEDSTRPSLPDSPGAADVVEAADAFLATLPEKERSVVLVELKAELAGRWSNFPDGVVPRNGVFFRDLKPEQVDAALKVARLALSPEGFARFQEIRAGDDLHGTQGPGGGQGPGAPQAKGGQPKGKAGGPGGGGVRFGASHYMIAFLGKPSKASPWMLQLGGHHLAFNLYYKGTTGSVPPYFVGVEPLTWKDSDGKTHAPLAPMRDAMFGLINALTPEQRGRARLDARFNDVYVGPGRDGQFPAKEGVPASELSDSAKQSLKQAFAAWTGDSLQSAHYRKLYDAEIDRTRVAYSGGTTLDEVGDYVRIDGPHAWIEFSCQRGVHYHTIWRDRATDYGAEFSF